MSPDQVLMELLTGFSPNEEENVGAENERVTRVFTAVSK